MASGNYGDTWYSIGNITPHLYDMYSWDSQNRLFAANVNALFEYDFVDEEWDTIVAGNFDDFHPCGTGVCAVRSDRSEDDCPASYPNSGIYKISPGGSWTRTMSSPCWAISPINYGPGSTLIALAPYCTDLADPSECSDGSHFYLSSTNGDSWVEQSSHTTVLWGITYATGDYYALWLTQVVGLQPMYTTTDITSWPVFPNYIDSTESAWNFVQEGTSAVWIEEVGGPANSYLYRTTHVTDPVAKFSVPGGSILHQLTIGSSYYWVATRDAAGGGLNGIYRSPDGDAWTEKLDGDFWTVEESHFN